MDKVPISETMGKVPVSETMDVQLEFDRHWKISTRSGTVCPGNRLIDCIQLSLYSYMHHRNGLIVGRVLDTVNNAELFAQVKVIFNGSALCDFICRMSRLAFDGEEDFDPVGSFNWSLRQFGFSTVSISNWSLKWPSSCRLQELWVQPELTWPLGLLLDETVIHSLNEVLRVLLELIRARQLFCRLILHRSTAMGNPSTAMGNRSTAMGNRSTAMGNRSTAMGNRSTAMGNDSIRIRRVMFSAVQTVALLVDLFHGHIDSLLANNWKQLHHVRSLSHALAVMTQLNEQLNDFLPRTDTKRVFHEAINKLCHLADQITTNIIITNVPFKCDQIIQWETLIERERQMLHSIAAHSKGDLYRVLSGLVK